MEDKKVYEEPEVTMVEFDFSDRIAASLCVSEMMEDDGTNVCYD